MPHLAFAALLGLTSLHAQDVLHLQDGRKLRGKVQRLASQSIAMLEVLPGGRGSAQRDIPPDQVAFIDFAPLPGEAEALADPANAAMEKRLLELWQEKSVNLRWPSNNAGLIGLTLAGQSMKSGDPLLIERAFRIYSLIEKEDWDEKRRDEAKRGRLRCLIQLKRIDEAIAEAQKLAESDEEPGLLLEAGLVLAQADFERLKIFEKDHPRWMEDDELAAARTKLYHQTLDQFLQAPLFHGSMEDKAAESLWGAVQVHLFAKENRAALDRARDLLQLYPKTSQAAEARKLLPSETPAPSPDQ
ncbi:MAG TPA: hypothetical protein DIT64_13075 [Verrucomicrobiales bacterium]|nr:hypothetical protein [Verrucomicrobiales bacterium]